MLLSLEMPHSTSTSLPCHKYTAHMYMKTYTMAYIRISIAIFNMTETKYQSIEILLINAFRVMDIWVIYITYSMCSVIRNCSRYLWLIS